MQADGIGKIRLLYKYQLYLTILNEWNYIMLVENQIVEISWTPATKNWLESKGYEFTKYRDKIMVKAEDLQPNSHVKIIAQCDYCGQEFTTEYCLCLRNLSTGKCCCNKCRKLKYRDNCIKKYGVANLFQLEEVKDKIKQTSFQKYGTERPCQSQEVKNKIKETNLSKYGYEVALQNPDIKSKAKQTCLDRFGVENVFQSHEIQKRIKETNKEKYGEGNIAHTPEIAEKIRNNNIKKYGVPYTCQVPSVISKMRQSLYQNGTVPSSKPEILVCDLLENIYGVENCFRGYPFDKINMDCMLVLNEDKIDVEYDGGYWHQNRQEKDKRRNYFLIKQGYKVLRIKGNKNDDIPTMEQIIKAIDYLVKGNHCYVEIDMNI